MPFSSLSLTRRDTAAVLTFNRPERRNAFSTEMIGEIVAVCDEIEEDAAVRSLIVTGGPDVFSAGADLTEAMKVVGPDDCARFFGNLHRLCAAVERLGKPVIAAIEGFCMTGGCEFALACDVRVAGEGATFAITSARIGTIAGAGGTQRLPRIVGLSNALAMLYSADPINADEALRIGLINRKTPRGSALAAALDLAAVYAKRAPLSLALTKKAVREGVDMNLQAALAHEIALVTKIYATRDKAEGVSAFLEKREPHFTGT